MGKLSVTNLLCCQFKNPLGYQLGEKPRFSWVVEYCGEAVVTRVEIAADEAFGVIIFDSGKQDDLNNVCFVPELELKRRTRYYWRVTVYGGEQTATAAAWFETSKMEEQWSAKWISPEVQPQRHPIIFSNFITDKEIRFARAYICGLGVYQLLINGDKAGDEALAPGLCAYDKWLPYQTYDLTELLINGENKVEIALGNGWYKGRYGLDRSREFHYGEEFAAICEIIVTYSDGSEQIFKTDTSWKVKLSNIIDSNIFDGEIRDDNLDAGTDELTKEANIPIAFLEPRRTMPTKIMHRLKPIELIHTPAGEIVLDMGQNMVGWLEFKCDAPKGKKIYIQFGEVMQNGNFYRENLRSAKAEFTYISDGEEKIVCQTHTFYGFRYVKLTEWHQEFKDVQADDFTGLSLYSDMPQTGFVKTSNDKVNRLIENALWGQRDNFLDVPTDCPQRDERMGWTGDAQVIFGTSAFNMDVAAFFAKFGYDLWKEQQAVDGAVPVTIPKHDVDRTGSCAWGDAATIIPWTHYTMYGDAAILEQQYPSMKAWVDYVRRHDVETGDTKLWRGSFHFGDWLALDADDAHFSRFGGTERTYLASCFYRYSSLLTAKAARVIGKNDEAEYYEQLSKSIRDAIVNEYFSPTGRLSVTTQTAFVVALHFDIVPEQFRERTAHALSLKLKETDFHLRTGFVGTPYLCRALSNTGYNNIAYRLLMQEGYPSWLYAVNLGATTIWERWNSLSPDGTVSDTGMNSFNHYAYGSIVEWIYRNAAGINPIEEFPGFKKFRLEPMPDPLLGGVEAEFYSRMGTIKSSWKYQENGEIEFDFTVPYGSTAFLKLPYHPDGDASLELTHGDYNYRYKPNVSPYKFNIDTPVRELHAYPEVMKLLNEEFTLSALTARQFVEMAGNRTLRDMCIEGFFELTYEKAEELSAKMSVYYDASKDKKLLVLN